MILLLVAMILPFSTFAEEIHSEEPMIVLTTDEYNDYKTSNNLPKKPFVISDDMEIPEGAELIADPRTTAVGKKLVEQYGSDLKKIEYISGDEYVVTTIDLKSYRVPSSNNPNPTVNYKSNSFFLELDSIITDTACAAYSTCLNMDTFNIITVNHVYYLSGLQEARQTTTTYVEEYKVPNSVFVYFRHYDFSRVSWWRANTEYSVKNATGVFMVNAQDYCNNKNINTSYYENTWTPLWKDTNNTYTYSFDPTNYVIWDPIRSGTELTKQLIEADLYRRDSKVYHLQTTYNIYKE